MRKMVIALIFVVPLLFVFIVFSSVNVVSLNVNVSVRDIKINREELSGLDENDTLFIDIAEHGEYTVSASVVPENATNAKYNLTSNNPDAVEVDGNGKIVAKREGEAVITATSNDGNHTDSITVIATSTKVYDFGFALFSQTDESQTDVLTQNGNVYSASVATGLYGYTVESMPQDIPAGITVESANGSPAVVDSLAKQILLPFTGSASVRLTLPDGASGKIEKTVNLTVTRPKDSDNGVLINGVDGSNTVFIEKDAASAAFYVESSSRPEFPESEGYSASVQSLGSRRYMVNVEFTGDAGNRNDLIIDFTAGSQSGQVRFSFERFDFNIGSDLPLNQSGGNYTAAIYRSSPAVFTAIPLVSPEDITFRWRASNADVVLKNSQTPQVTVTAGGSAEQFTLTVEALRNGSVIVSKDIQVTAVIKITSIMLSGIPKDTDLADRYTIGGKTYGENGALVNSSLSVRAITYGGSSRVDGYNDVGFETSSNIITVERSGGGFELKAAGTGEATVTFFWEGNELFGKSVRYSAKVNVVADGVEVSTYSQLKKAVEAGEKVVLKDDIMLGTDDSGAPLSSGERSSILAGQRIASTYNTEWYRYSPDATIEAAKITYAMEFKNDVFGNGHTINSEYFSHALDGTGNPAFEIYRGPLYFVKYKEMASVAGQDNCAFLIRTDGVKLYGVNLLGCLDESLYDNGAYNLNNLNYVGTTLDVNASVDIVNCRIRNGRNVIRTYGGNRNGEQYMIGMLNSAQTCNDDRITVNIKGCILSQGREFLLKVGTNRALRASLGNPEPVFTNEHGVPYQTSDGKSASNNYNLLDDKYFYEHYVLTDVTLNNSVLETSGLFAVGVESNFAGVMLAPGYTGDYSVFTQEWQKSGGTSFASVLRLEGDVRMYEWKDLALIDSSTLIESPIGALSQWLKLDINNMFNYVYSTNKDLYGGLIHNDNGARFAHGGIAFYGGGINYSQISLDGLNPEIADLKQYNINIDVLKGSTDANLNREGEWLPKAAGTRDFRFYLYGADSKNFGFERQRADEESGSKYKGIVPSNIF